MRSLQVDKKEGSGGDSFVLVGLERLKLQHLRHGARQSIILQCEECVLRVGM